MEAATADPAATDDPSIVRKPTSTLSDRKSRSSWRRSFEAASARPLLRASAIDEAKAQKAIDRCLTRNDALMTKLRASMPFEQAAQQASLSFKQDISKVCDDVLDRRDTALLEAIGDRDDAQDGFRVAQQLGMIHPPWLELRGLDIVQALNTFVAGLEASRAQRHYSLLQRLVREVSERRRRRDPSYTLQMAPGPLALPEASRVLGASEVSRLCAGEAVVLDAPPLLRPHELARVEADLRALLRGSGVPSDSPCNVGSRACFLPLLAVGDGGGASVDYPLSPETRRLLRLLAALPAEVERHGWRRKLAVPHFAQLAMYPASNGSRYAPHLDRWEHEEHNRREITCLLYLNHGWDAERCGGCLRLHPADRTASPAATAGGAAPVDVEPTAGRMVLFDAGKQMHEVLPCRGEGVERLALTLWIEYEG